MGCLQTFHCPVTESPSKLPPKILERPSILLDLQRKYVDCHIHFHIVAIVMS